MDSQVIIIIFGNCFIIYPTINIWSRKIFISTRFSHSGFYAIFLGSVSGIPNHSNSIETTSMSSSGSHIQHRTKSASLNPFKGFSKLNPFHRKSERSSKKYKQKADKVLNVRKWLVTMSHHLSPHDGKVLGVNYYLNPIPWRDENKPDMAYLGLTLVENLIVSVSIDYRLKTTTKNQEKTYPQQKTMKKTI